MRRHGSESITLCFWSKSTTPVPCPLALAFASATYNINFKAIFNLYGSAWSQGRRTYAPVRTPGGALVSEKSFENGAVAESVDGSVKPSDCHRLLRDEGGLAGVPGHEGRGDAAGVSSEPR